MLNKSFGQTNKFVNIFVFSKPRNLKIVTKMIPYFNYCTTEANRILLFFRRLFFLRVAKDPADEANFSKKEKQNAYLKRIPILMLPDGKL